MNEIQVTPLNSMITMWTDPEQLKTIRSIYAKDATELEFKTFVELGIATGLNPFLREIWLVKYDKNAAAQIFIGRDGYRKSISKNNNYRGHHSDAVYSNDDFCFDLTKGEVKHTYNLKDRGKLLGAYSVVHMQNVPRPYYVFVELSEYDLNHSLWKTKKATMIKKVAECQAIRMADSCTFGGTYSEDEMPEKIMPVSKAKDLNQKLGLTIDAKAEPATQEVNLETGEVTQPTNDESEPMTLDHVKFMIDSATKISHLINAIDYAKALPEEDRKIARTLYKEKERELNVSN